MENLTTTSNSVSCILYPVSCIPLRRRTLHLCANGGKLRLVRVLRFLWSHNPIQFSLRCTYVSSHFWTQRMESMRLPSHLKMTSPHVIVEYDGIRWSPYLWTCSLAPDCRAPRIVSLVSPNQPPGHIINALGMESPPKYHNRIHNFRPEPGRHGVIWMDIHKDIHITTLFYYYSSLLQFTTNNPPIQSYST